MKVSKVTLTHIDRYLKKQCFEKYCSCDKDANFQFYRVHSNIEI